MVGNLPPTRLGEVNPKASSFSFSNPAAHSKPASPRRRLDLCPLADASFLTFQQPNHVIKSKRNLTRFTYETTAFQGWRLCICRAGSTFTRYFSDKQCGGPRKALKAAEVKLAEFKAFLDSAPRRQGKLTKAAEAGARKLLKADC